MLRKLLTLALLLALLCPSAMAIKQGGSAEATDWLPIYVGPGPAYEEIFTLTPDTRLVAIEMEEAGGVIWALCDFGYQGRRIRGYAELDALELSDPILWSTHYDLERTVVNNCEVYYGPDDHTPVRAEVRPGDRVTLLDYEGAYCFIEYRSGSRVERGYVHEFAFWVDQGEFGEYFPDNEYSYAYVVQSPAHMYSVPDESYPPMETIPYDTCVAVDYGNDAFDGWISVYYGGQWGFALRRNFNDLRGFIEPDR